MFEGVRTERRGGSCLLLGTDQPGHATRSGCAAIRTRRVPCSVSLLHLLFNRARVPVERRAFRFSDALNETGRYGLGFAGYDPIGLPGDPVIDDSLPRREAQRLFEALSDIAPERRRFLTGFLSQYGLQPGGDEADWQRIEVWLHGVIEPSVEPADGQWPRLRPLAEALLLDLALAFADAAVAHHGGTLRLAFAGDLLGPGVRRCDGFPVLVDTDGRLRSSPRGRFLLVGANAASGFRPELTVLDAAWRSLAVAPGADERSTAIAALYRWVEAHEADTGVLPTIDELAAYVLEDRIAAEDVPAELFERLRKPR
jgi:hypothetical protein